MKRIKLTQGKYALVDDEDYDRVKRLKWCYSQGYALHSTHPSGKIYLHRFVMNTPEGMSTDHINGDVLDNRKCNLRVCTHKQNLRNQKLNTANTSGYKGVSWCKRTKKWKAYICVNDKGIYGGYFIIKIDAARRYDELALKYFGEFARLNFPTS
jgi:hypothetical protein